MVSSQIRPRGRTPPAVLLKCTVSPVVGGADGGGHGVRYAACLRSSSAGEQ